MPIKSQAQRRKFAELLMKGEISEEVYERWNREAGSRVLPERVKPKDKRAAKTKARKSKKRVAEAKTKKRAARPKRRATSRSRRKT